MYAPQPYPPKHHTKFYIVMTTLVIGAILFVLFMNNDSNNFGLTSFTVKDTNQGGEELRVSDALDAKQVFPDLNQRDKDSSAKESSQDLNEVDVSLSFNTIPAVKKDAKIKDLELHFDDLNTKIDVNGDKLELNNLKEVNLNVRGFVGQMDFDDQGFSLDGTARGIAVNDVSLSSKGNIRISFNNLHYRSFSIDEIELNNLELSNGDGILKVAEKLSYALEQDQLLMYYFNGGLTIDRDAENSLMLEGVAKGIVVSGALLNFNLR